MTRFIFPVLLLAASIGLFMLYTNPQYQQVKSLKAQAASYDDALNKSQELKKVRDQLLARYNTFSQDDRAKLQAVLPDNVDNIRLVIDINNIASRHALAIKDLAIGKAEDGATVRSAAAVGASGSAVGSVDLGFAVTASYDDFLAFLADLEHSLRLVDVENIGLTTSDKGLMNFTLSIRTYWLH